MAAGAKGLAGGRPSMLQDVMRGRRTEIDYLNGYVVDQGRRVGVKTPFNEMIVQLVHEHGVGTLKPVAEEPRAAGADAAALMAVEIKRCFI